MPVLWRQAERPVATTRLASSGPLVLLTNWLCWKRTSASVSGTTCSAIQGAVPSEQGLASCPGGCHRVLLKLPQLLCLCQARDYASLFRPAGSTV